MPKLVVRAFAISLDGYSAAPGQAAGVPFGRNGLRGIEERYEVTEFKPSKAVSHLRIVRSPR